MRKYFLRSTPFAAGLLLIGCATIPSGPSVLVLPGSGRTFEQFNYDDALCRQWSEQQTGETGNEAATESTITGAVIGTAVGAAAGAAVGAAAGDPGTGAAVGSGVGLLGGTAVGADHGYQTAWELQRRYDMAYMQCMYAKGHQVPVPRGSLRSAHASAPPPPDVPPPPPGNPPPPPPYYYR